jgi:hypothetical protein
MYFVLALACPLPWLRRGIDERTAGLVGMALSCPSETALCDPRRRLGAAPLKSLFEGGRRAADPTAYARGVLAGLHHGRLLRPQLAEGARHRPQIAGGWVASATGWASPAIPRYGAETGTAGCSAPPSRRR